MSCLERLRIWCRRVDVRLGCILAVLFAPLVAVVLFALYLFAADELFELATFEVDERLGQLESAWRETDPALRAAKLTWLGEQLALDAGGFRVVGEDDSLLLVGGSLPTDAQGDRSPRLLRAARLRADDELEASRILASGERVEVFLSSAGFVRERDEILRGFWISLALGVGLVALVAVPATRQALAPLRRATGVAASIDAGRLEARLPTRGTRDDVDRHAQAVNRLLDQIELGFGRLRGFSQDVAHELRTPINRILNAAELQLLEQPEGNASRPEIESIRGSAEQMARLVDGLLLLARGEMDRLAEAGVPLDVAELCRMIEEMYEPACEEASVRFEVRSESAIVRADPSLLLRALGNLIDNALSQTPPGGRIRLWTHADETDDRFVSIELQDSGPGIAVAERERVFERFVRLSESANPAGVGLGLPITRALLRAFGGDVEIRDPDEASGEEETRGARFVIRLPRA